MARSPASFLSGLMVGLTLSSGIAVAAHPRVASATAQLVDRALDHTWRLQQLAREVRQPQLRDALLDTTADLAGDLERLERATADRPRRDRPARPVRPAPPPPPPIVPLADILRAMDAAPFGDDKLQVLTDAAAGRPFTTAEVVAVMDTITFDDDKVDAAARLYPHVVDPERWFTVYASLTFSSSQDELRRRVGGR